MEKIDKVAKNLLEDKTCDNCVHQFARIGCARKTRDIYHGSFPKENTCENWSRWIHSGGKTWWE